MYASRLWTTYPSHSFGHRFQALHLLSLRHLHQRCGLYVLPPLPFATPPALGQAAPRGLETSLETVGTVGDSGGWWRTWGLFLWIFTMGSTGTLGYGGIFKQQMEFSVILPKHTGSLRSEDGVWWVGMTRPRNMGISSKVGIWWETEGETNRFWPNTNADCSNETSGMGGKRQLDGQTGNEHWIGHIGNGTSKHSVNEAINKTGRKTPGDSMVKGWNTKCFVGRV